jgi:SAM-dependent methyltransferase
VQRAFDFEHARFQDSQRVHFRPELVDEFCADAKLPPEWFAGKRVLDAGCGSGRWSYALARMGAHVTAVDLTDSGVRAARAALQGYPGCTVYQASIFALPFPPGSFDFVFSWGVLHHTPDTHAAFERLAPLVKPGGVLFVMVYERVARRYRMLTDAVRALMRRLPDGWRYRACELLVIRDPRWYRLVSPWLKVCDGSAARTPLEQSTLVFDTFDAYSPKYNHVHTQGDVRGWFRAAGFAGVTLTHPIKHTAPDAVARWGECGGAVHVRGTKPLADGAVPPLPEYRAPSRAPADGASEPLPTFDREWTDEWHGIAFRHPSSWIVQAHGNSVSLAPNMAIPPYQLGVHVSIASAGRPVAARAAAAFARWLPTGNSVSLAPNMAIPPYQLGVHVSIASAGRPVAARAAAAFARWLPTDQRAELDGERAVRVAGQPALEQRYSLSYGLLSAPARFVAFEHNGQLCLCYGVSGWDNPETTGQEMHAALDCLLETVGLRPTRRSLRTAAQYAWRSRGRLGRIAWRALRHFASRGGLGRRAG